MHAHIHTHTQRFTLYNVNTHRDNKMSRLETSQAFRGERRPELGSARVGSEVGWDSEVGWGVRWGVGGGVGQ